MARSAKVRSAPEGLPLCVDFEGVLVGKESFWEILFFLIRSDFLYLFRIIFWRIHTRIKGKCQLTLKIAERADLIQVF